MLKRFLFILSAGIIFLLSSFKAVAPKHFYRIKTVVIDAGHGGHDTGCSGSSSKEKTVALSIALKLGKLIEEKFPEVNVVYTRKTDVFIELHERAAIANRNHADLFLCIHCNSGPPSAFGVETFVMGLHKSDDNLSVAKRENSSILYEKDYKKNYDGFDPDSPEANIIFSLYQNSFLNQSLKLASLIQQQTEEYAGRFNRGVKQAGFLVLYRTTMPGLLFESGFLTNRTEEKFLSSDKGQTTMATVIFRAFNEYKADMEAGSEQSESAVKKAEADLPKAVEVKENKMQSGELPVDSNDLTKPAESKKKEAVKTEPKPAAKTPAPDKTTTPATEKIPELYYTVQAGALPDPTAADLKPFAVLGDYNIFKADDGLIRINCGMFTDFNKATAMQAKVRGKGFKDAFVTIYHKNKRITLKEAQQLNKKN